VRKGVLAPGVCGPLPTGSDDRRLDHDAADQTSILGVNKKCGDVGAIRDCAGTDDYPDGAS
jgi:hypothetical protein